MKRIVVYDFKSNEVRKWIIKEICIFGKQCVDKR